METREAKRGSPAVATRQKHQFQEEKTLGKKRPRRSTSSSPKNYRELENTDLSATTSFSKTTHMNTTDINEIEPREKGPLAATDGHTALNDDIAIPSITAPIGVSLPWFEHGGPLYERPASLLWDTPKDVDRSRKGERNRKQALLDQKDISKQATKHFAGVPIPSKTLGICAECGMDGEEDNRETKHGNVVVLCDGPGCDREFHLRCCKPPLLQVPEGDFFCFDCHPNGGYAVTLLEEYLDETENKRDAHNHELLRDEIVFGSSASSCNDMEDVDKKNTFVANGTSPNASKATSSSNRRVRRMSHSETPTRDSDTNSNITSPSKRKRKDISESFTFVDKLIYEDLKENQPEALSQLLNGICSEAKGKGPPRSELEVFHREKHGNEGPLLVGCAVRLYCPKTNHYQTGRILKIREPPDNRDPNNVVLEDYDRNHDTECLVRFPAGRDYRKKNLTRWIRLEEHSLAVACPNFVWGKFASSELEGFLSSSPASKKKRKSSLSPSTPKHSWVPTKLWMRSSRELVMSMQLLDESLGQIGYRDFRKAVDTNSGHGNCKASTPHKNGKIQPNSHVHGESVMSDSKNEAVTPAGSNVSLKSRSYLHQEWMLAECIGREVYKLVHLPTETKAYCCEESPGSASPTTTKAKNNGSNKKSPKKPSPQQLRDSEIMLALVQAEQEEQDRVRSWNKLPLQNTWHKKALTCLDEHCLDPLAFDSSYHRTNVYTTQDVVREEEGRIDDNEEKRYDRTVSIEPTPLIRTGLDRMYILEQFVTHFNGIQEMNCFFSNTPEDRLQGTKDMALSLSSELVGNHSITACIQKQNKMARLRQEKIITDLGTRKSEPDTSELLVSSSILSQDSKQTSIDITKSERTVISSQATNGIEIIATTNIGPTSTERLVPKEELRNLIVDKGNSLSTQSPTSMKGMSLLVSNETKVTNAPTTVPSPEILLSKESASPVSNTVPASS